MTRVLMLSGDEGALRRRALGEALTSAGVSSDDLEVAVIDGAVPPNDWLSEAQTAPFISEFRVVVVRNVLRSEAPAEFADRLANLPDFSRLILVADDETGDDSRQQRLKTIRKGWEAAVNKGKGKVETFEISPKEVQSSIRRAKRPGWIRRFRTVAHSCLPR